MEFKSKNELVIRGNGSCQDDAELPQIKIWRSGFFVKQWNWKVVYRKIIATGIIHSNSSFNQTVNGLSIQGTPQGDEFWIWVKCKPKNINDLHRVCLKSNLVIYNAEH